MSLENEVKFNVTTLLMFDIKHVEGVNESLIQSVSYLINRCYLSPFGVGFVRSRMCEIILNSEKEFRDKITLDDIKYTMLCDTVKTSNLIYDLLSAVFKVNLVVVENKNILNGLTVVYKTFIDEVSDMVFIYKSQNDEYLPLMIDGRTRFFKTDFLYNFIIQVKHNITLCSIIKCKGFSVPSLKNWEAIEARKCLIPNEKIMYCPFKSNKWIADKEKFDYYQKDMWNAIEKHQIDKYFDIIKKTYLNTYKDETVFIEMCILNEISKEKKQENFKIFKEVIENEWQTYIHKFHYQDRKEEIKFFEQIISNHVSLEKIINNLDRSKIFC